MENYENNKFSTEEQNIPEAANDAEVNPPAKTRITKKPAGPVIALMIAIALVGSSTGFLTTYIARSQFFIPQKTTNSTDEYGGALLPEYTTSATTDFNDIPSFLINSNIAEVNSTKQFTPEELYEAVSEAVVAIKTSYTYRIGREYISEASVVGSGVVFTTDGYVLTNHHVIEDAEGIWVVVTDEDGNSDSAKEYEAEVVGSDKESDIAVLKISGDKDFAIVPIGDSSVLKIGQQISAIGYPLGLERTMTTGIVSGLNRIVYPTGGYELSSIQITAAINPGNSGGPLFDMYGNVVGIVNKKLVYETIENIGFAITIDEAKPIVNDLMEFGKITSRPILGITGWELNEQIAEMYGFVGVEGGVLVQGITQTAPVAQSGLAVGDIIIKINDRNIMGIADIQAATKNLRAGDTVSVTVVRFDQFKNKVEETLTVELTSQSVAN